MPDQRVGEAGENCWIGTIRALCLGNVRLVIQTHTENLLRIADRGQEFYIAHWESGGFCRRCLGQSWQCIVLQYCSHVRVLVRKRSAEINNSISFFRAGTAFTVYFQNHEFHESSIVSLGPDGRSE